MLVNRTADIPNRLNTMQTLIDDKETRLTGWEIQRQQYEVEQEQRRTARETEQQERAAATDGRKASESQHGQLQRRMAADTKR